MSQIDTPRRMSVQSEVIFIQETVSKMIGQKLPLQFAQSPLYRHFQKYAYLPSISYLKTVEAIDSLFNLYTLKLKEQLKKCVHFAVTCDGWLDRNGVNLLGVTVHFIDASFKLRSLTLGIKKLDSGTAINLEQVLRDILDDAGLDPANMSALVTDGASAMVAMARGFLGVPHFICVAHFLNRLIGEILECTVLTGKTQPSSTTLLKLVEQLRAVVIQTRNTKAAKRALKLAGTPPPPLYIETRWSSLYGMLHNSITFKSKLEEALRLHVEPSKRVSFPDEHAWSTYQVLLEVIEPLNQLQEWMGGENYVTSSSMISRCKQIHEQLKRMDIGAARPANHAERVRQPMVTASLKYFASHTQHLYHTSATIVLAMLDPRMKSSVTQHWDTFVHAVREFFTLHPYIPPSEENSSPERPSKTRTNVRDDLETELEIYHTTNFPCQRPALEYWDWVKVELPMLAYFSKAKLCTPATSVPTERLFSVCGYATLQGVLA